MIERMAATSENGATDTTVPAPKSGTLRKTDPFRGFLALDDFEAAARMRLPRMIYGYVAGGSETGSALANARAAYSDLCFVPRTLRDVSGRSQACEIFGRRYAHPFGVAPLGGAAMVSYRADLQLADAAEAANVPMILSASSLISLEEVRRNRPNTWFQAYLAGDQARIDAMTDRVAAAGYETLVVTADTPLSGNRENNLRNGFSLPLRISPRVALDSTLHPRWLVGVIARTLYCHGVPHLENLDATRGPPMLSQKIVRSYGGRDRLTWRHIEAIRRRWPGRLVVKGLLSAADAVIAREAGCDGIIVSNHGGRQLDYAIAPLRVLPEIVTASQGMTVMIDGGIRRGTDVVKALALGARYVFLGRPFLYAAAIGGAVAVQRAMAILAAEIDTDLALLGAQSIDELTPALLRGFSSSPS